MAVLCDKGAEGGSDWEAVVGKAVGYRDRWGGGGGSWREILFQVMEVSYCR